VTRVAYLASRYPAVSHTFIAREVAGLRARGVEVDTFSVRAVGAADALAEDDRRSRATTTNLLPLGPRGALGLLATTLRHPRAVAGLVAGAVRGTGRFRPRGAAYALEAVVLHRHLRRRGIRHVHAHFANVAADVAALTTELGRRLGDEGRTWSFTMHGPTELADVTGFALPWKVTEADGVLCISDFCRSQLMGLVTEAEWPKLHVVHCGVPLPAFAPVERAGDGPLHVLCVGRLVPEKGQALLLEALRTLLDDGVAARLTLVGDGPRRADLERRAAELGLGDAVHFAGAVGQDEIRRHYVEADVFALPSFAEGVPVVLMEAMATGLPVVTTRIAGIPELVEDGVSGCVLPPGRVDLLAAALAELAADPERRRRMGAAGRAAVEAGYDIDGIADQLVSWFAATAP
jgi:glycosyltransferase involved in cell wall biosynthesis